MLKILAWISFGCALLFSALALTAAFAGETIGIPGVPVIYAAVAVAVIGILAAIALVVLGRLD